jgi:hypothetical protein
MHDPYQADEAAAFTLTIQSGRPQTDTTMDMFGVPGDEVADLLARCAAHTRHDVPDQATSDFLTATIHNHTLDPDRAPEAVLTRRYADLTMGSAFSFLPEGDVYVRCRGGYRPGCGGALTKFNYADCPVYLWGAADV